MWVYERQSFIKESTSGPEQKHYRKDIFWRSTQLKVKPSRNPGRTTCCKISCKTSPSCSQLPTDAQCGTRSNADQGPLFTKALELGQIAACTILSKGENQNSGWLHCISNGNSRLWCLQEAVVTEPLLWSPGTLTRQRIFKVQEMKGEVFHCCLLPKHLTITLNPPVRVKLISQQLHKAVISFPVPFTDDEAE